MAASEHANPLAAGPDEIDFHFDVLCPWAYQTSLWIRNVRAETGLTINWRFFSLEEINLEEGKKHPWEREWSYGWSMMRIGAALRRMDMALLDEWYLRAATALHVEGLKPHRKEVAEHIVGEMGLDPAIVDEAIADQTTTDEVKAEHDRVVELGTFGVPTLVFPDGQALFGPVLLDPPEGESAVRLWDRVAGFGEWPNLFELKRPKSPEHLAAIAEKFRPYFESRDWESVENPAP